MVAALALVTGWLGCTFDLPEVQPSGAGGASSASSGVSGSASISGSGVTGSASTNAGGSGTGGGACVDTIVSGPKILGGTNVSGTPVQIGLGAVGGRFGLAYRDGTGDHFATFAPNDASVTVPFTRAGSTFYTNPRDIPVASRPWGFSVAEWTSMDRARVRRFGPNGEDLGASNGTPETGITNAMVVTSATSAGVLLVYYDDVQGHVRSAFVADGQAALSAITNIGASLGLSRYHAAVGTTTGFALLWSAATDDQRFTMLAANGADAMTIGSAQILPLGLPPITFTAARATLGGGSPTLMFASELGLISFEETGMLPVGVLDESNVVLGSSGTSFRGARFGGTTIEWRRIDPMAGLGPIELSLAVSQAEQWVPPAIAWDGSGYGVVWSEAGGLAFARIDPCGL
jgi:hypothetical protein